MGNSIKNVQEVLIQMEKILRGQYNDMIVIVSKGDELTVTVPSKHIQKMADRMVRHVLNEARREAEAANKIQESAEAAAKRSQFLGDVSEALHLMGFTRDNTSITTICEDIKTKLIELLESNSH